MKRFSILFFAVALSFAAMAESQNGAVYVKLNGTGDGSSWENAMGNIQKAVSAAKADDAARKDVWVAGGEYVLTAPVAMIDSVNVYGGFAGTETSVADRQKTAGGKAWDFANVTILKGDSCRLLQAAANLDMPTVFDGFTLTDGNGVGSATSGSGGAALLRDNLILQNCIVQNSSSMAAGGGVMMNAGGTVRYCLVKNNVHTTGANGGGGIFANTSSGGKTIYIENCEITGNTSTVRGAGLNIQGQSTVYVSNCVIYNNTAMDGTTLKPGGALYDNGANISIITNNVIYNNTGGSALYVKAGKCINNTVVKNVGNLYIAAGNANAEVLNNLVWGCATDDSGATPTSLGGSSINGMKVQNNATYNPIPTDKGWELGEETNIQFSSNNSNGDIEEPSFGVGSGPKFVKVTTFIGALPAGLSAVDAEPFLMELDSADWRLNANSPCVNAGQATNMVVSDIMGDNRPQGFPIETALYDIGAYELSYYMVAFDNTNPEQGDIFSADGNALSADTLLGFAKGQEIELYFFAKDNKAMMKVTTIASTDGGLTYTGAETDITSEINTDGLLKMKVYENLKIKVQWDVTALPAVDASAVQLINVSTGMQIRGAVVGDMIQVYHIGGAMLYAQKAAAATVNIALSEGIYIVRINDRASKFIVK